MELIPLVVLVVLGVPIALAVWLIARAIQTRGRIDELAYRLGELEAEIIQLKRELPPVARRGAQRVGSLRVVFGRFLPELAM